MGRHSLEYPKDALNLVKRHGERGKSTTHPSQNRAKKKS